LNLAQLNNKHLPPGGELDDSHLTPKSSLNILFMGRI